MRRFVRVLGPFAGPNVFAFVAALCLLFVAFAAGGPPSSQSPPSNGFPAASVKMWVDQMIGEQVAALGCDTTPRLSKALAVRNAGSLRDGVFDTGVVRVVSFDQGSALAQQGKVWVVGWCGS